MGKGWTGVCSLHAKETYAGQVGPEQYRQTSLQEIAKKAKENKTHRFGNLYRLLDAKALKAAFKHLKKKAAAGIDKVTARDYEKELESNFDTGWANSRAKRTGRNWYDGSTSTTGENGRSAFRQPRTKSSSTRRQPSCRPSMSRNSAPTATGIPSQYRSTTSGQRLYVGVEFREVQLHRGSRHLGFF